VDFIRVRKREPGGAGKKQRAEEGKKGKEGHETGGTTNSPKDVVMAKHSSRAGKK